MTRRISNVFLSHAV